VHDAMIIQEPVPPAGQLVLLFHGVGAGPQDLAPLGASLAERFGQAWIVSVRSPDVSDFGAGWQWFSVQGLTETNRPARVAAAMPRFVQTVRHWQHETGVGAAATTLIGFSQGAIMSLEATQLPETIAGRVVAIAGRFASPPRLAAARTSVHLMHGETDRVMPHAMSVEAQARLQALGAQATLDSFAGLGHGIDARVVECIVRRLDEPISRDSP
jgi:phospholipase/carboxylesterase